MSLSDFQILEKLGNGSFSNVFRVIRNSDSLVYALKKVKFSTLSQKEKESALNEVRILASFTHPNLIAYKEAFIDESTSTLCIVMELADEDLQKKISFHKSSGTFFPEEEIWRAIVQITQGLMLLHSNNIIHRDLKSANIFISNHVMKIGDLNISKVNKDSMAHTQIGTPYYACPEIWKSEPYDFSCDIWSFGCVIYEMAALVPPFTGNMKDIGEKVKKGSYPKIPAQYSSDLVNTIRSFIQVKPSLRVPSSGILALPTVKRNVDAIIHATEESQKLLDTIKFDLGLKNIKKKLPGPKYETKKKVFKKSDSLNTPYINKYNELLSVDISASGNKNKPVESLLHNPLIKMPTKGAGIDQMVDRDKYTPMSRGDIFYERKKSQDYLNKPYNDIYNRIPRQARIQRINNNLHDIKPFIQDPYRQGAEPKTPGSHISYKILNEKPEIRIDPIGGIIRTPKPYPK